MMAIEFIKVEHRPQELVVVQLRLQEHVLAHDDPKLILQRLVLVAPAVPLCHA